MIKDSRYDNYTQLLSKVDEMFFAVKTRHEGQLACQSGCYGCCQPGLTVSNIEASRIRDWLAENRSIAEKLRDSSQMLGDQNYCGILDSKGQCSIYEVRPMICRSHGMPVSWDVGDGLGESGAESKEERDVCPLNFEGIELNSLPKSDVLSLDKLNVLLSLIDRQFDEAKAGVREKLEDIK